MDGTNTRGETVNKELIGIIGAHNSMVSVIQAGPNMKDALTGETSLTFSSASEDGKILSFATPIGIEKREECMPCCVNVVNHGLADRYNPDVDPISVTALACLEIQNNHSSVGKSLEKKTHVLLSGVSSGNINLLKPSPMSTPGNQKDALILYRQQIEEEALTLHTIAENLVMGVESRDRKYRMKTYKHCFLGSNAVSFLVDNAHTASRNDALNLGRVLASHLALFRHVVKEDNLLEDDKKSFYRFSQVFTTSLKEGKLKKINTM